MSRHALQAKLEEAILTETGRAFYQGNGTAAAQGRMFGWGTTPGNGIEGWAPGAFFLDLDAAVGARVLVNEGSNTAATWAAIASINAAQTWALLQTFTLGITSNGPITTTDGVAAGTARKVGGTASVAVAAGSALTGSASETVLATYTIPANTIKSGTVIRVRWQHLVTADNAATTLTQRLRLGTTTLTGTALVTGTATDTAANNILGGEFTLVGRAAPGASAAIVGYGTFKDGAAPGAGTLKDATLATTNFATNGALILEATGQWNASDANSVRNDIFIVDVIG